MKNFFNPFTLLKFLLSNFIPFQPIDNEFQSSINHFSELVSKLIEDSKKKIKNNEKLTSILDYMVLSHLNGDINSQELNSNVFIFFLAGHETTSCKKKLIINNKQLYL
jgi:cytochrome P450